MFRRACAVVVALSGLLLAPGASARPGTLDRGFSGDGLAKVTRGGGTIPVAVLPAAGGAISVLTEGGDAVVRVRRDGRPDPRFGRRGIASLPVVADADGNAAPRAFAVRPSDGAILVAGKSRGDVVTVSALDARGRVLTSFGRGGVAALPQQAFASGASQLLVEPDGGVTWAVTRSTSYPSAPVTPDLAWLRLTASGAPDAGFGTSGVVRLVTGTQTGYGRAPSALWRTPSGALRVALQSYEQPVALYGLTPGGAPSLLAAPAFGGRIVTEPGRLVAPVGDDLLVADTGTGDRRTTTRLSRLADGGLGPARWTAHLGRRLPIPDIVIPDRQGGAYVAGAATRGARTTSYQRVIAVAHVKAGGVVDRRFGRNGILDVHLRGHNRFISTPSLCLDRARGRLWLVADAGSGYFDIREDFGGHDVVVAAIRTR